MSVDRARTMGLTARDLAEALADAAGDDPGSAPTLQFGAPDIGTATRATWLDDRPAAWAAFGEPREEQQ